MTWRRRTGIAWSVLAAIAVLSACGSDDAAPTASAPEPTPASESPAPAGQAAGSTTATVSDDTDPATTDSSASKGDATLVAREVDATDEVLAVLGEPGTAASASELAEAVADAFASAGDPAAVERVDQGEPAIALVTVLVPGDDAIDAVRYRVQMTESGPGAWRVAAATRAYVCSRATDDELCG